MTVFSDLRIKRATVAVLAAVVSGAVCAHAPAQPITNPVYVDDSTAAAEAISQARARIASDDLNEAVRLLQLVMADEGDRLLPTKDDPDLLVTARSRLIEEMLSQPPLLQRYRELQTARAQTLLDQGSELEVARSFFLTAPGFEAMMRLAERRLEAAQFNGAWRTLALLDQHPDRTDLRAQRALRLLERIVPFTDAVGAQTLAAQWRRETTSINAPPIQVQTPELNIGRTPLDPGPTVALSDLVAQPLASQPLLSPVIGDDRAVQTRRRSQVQNQLTPLNYILPAVAGDLIYVNDGRTFSAWERFTLQEIWRLQYAPASSIVNTTFVTSGRNAVEDMATMAVSGRWAVGIGGLAHNGAREFDSAVRAVDAFTGAPRWTVRLSDLDASLHEGSFRGVPIIDQGVVVVGVVKSIKERRLLSFHMVGLDLHTGQRLWARPVASSGTLPYGAPAKVADFAASADGLIFQVDSLGFLAAVETVTGRVQWVRRLPLQSPVAALRRTWEGSSVVINEGLLYAITPDQRQVIAVDCETGEVRAARASSDFRDPLYLIRTSEHLVSVSDERVSSIAFASFDDPQAAPTVILDVRSSRIDGRVATAGERVLAPTPEGVRIARADATDPGLATTAPLDQSGNLVALESELVVANETHLHTYLLWEVAERVLTERMDASPNDPAPAATFVDLAYRAGRPEKILPAVDAALGAIEINPLDDHNKHVRRRLFESLWQIVAADRRDAKASTISPQLQAELVDRLGRAAGSPQERVRFLLAEGAFYEAHDQPVRAVDSFQQILNNPALASTNFDSGGVAAEADIEATKGLTRIVRRFGPSVYRVYDAQAQRELLAMQQTQDPAPFAALAKQYPVSATAAQAWLRAAERYERQGQTRRALAALEDGLVAAESALIDDPALLGEMAGRLIASLTEAGRLETAASLLRTIRERTPELILTNRGETLALDSVSAQLSDLLAEVHRLPEIGLPGEKPSTQLLSSWRIERPLLSQDVSVSAESILMRAEGFLALWRVQATSGMREVWRTPVVDRTDVIASTWDSVILIEPGDGGQVFTLLDRATGAVQWRTAPVADLLPLAPDQPNLAPEPAFAAMDHRTLVVVRADGRAVAFDLKDGARIWTSPRILPVVADIAAEADTLLVVGDRVSPNPQIPGLEPSPAAVALDLRTGQTLKTIELKIGLPRWARLTTGALAIVGADMGVMAYDILRDRQVWLTDELAGLRTIDAWALDDRVVILDADAGLWQVSNGENQPKTVAIDTKNKLSRTVLVGQPIRWMSLGDSMAMAGIDGVLVIDHNGRVIGMDQRSDDLTVVPAAFGAHHIVTVGTAPAFFEAGAKWHDLFIFKSPGAAMAQRRLVELDASPEDVALLDGRILITAGKATLVIDAPADEPEPRARARGSD